MKAWMKFLNEKIVDFVNYCNTFEDLKKKKIWNYINLYFLKF